MEAKLTRRVRKAQARRRCALGGSGSPCLQKTGIQLLTTMATTYRKTNITHTAPDEQRALALLAMRHGLTKAAKLSGRNWATVRRYCRELGVKPKRVKKNTPQATRWRAVNLYRLSNLSLAAVGAKFGVTGARVWGWVREAA